MYNPRADGLDLGNTRDTEEVYAYQRTYKANKYRHSIPGLGLETKLRRSNKIVQFWILLFLRFVYAT